MKNYLLLGLLATLVILTGCACDEPHRTTTTTTEETYIQPGK